jgi:DNA-binding MarR family transcriptional regulator
LAIVKKVNSSKSNFALWLLIGKANHLLLLKRRRELIHYEIPPGQLHILNAINVLSPSATIAGVANELDREVHVISRQTVSMEKYGLIKRIKSTPRSNLLTLELTDKGLNLVEISGHSESIEKILSSLTKQERQQMELILNKIIAKTEKR